MRTKWRTTLQDRERLKTALVHFLKFSGVGASGVPVNALLFWLLCQVASAGVAAFLAFTLAGQYVYWLQNWKVFVHHKALNPWHRAVMFNVGNFARAFITGVTLSLVSALGATHWVAYIVAMVVSIPSNYWWNKRFVHKAAAAVSSDPDPEPELVEMNE